TEVSLDQLEGTVLDVGPESVQFEYDGEKIDVPRGKLEAVVYYHPARREFSAPACKLVDVGGSAWSLKSLELAEGQVRGSTVGGVAIDFPLSAVAKIDYSVGNVFFLAELEPDTGAGAPAVSLQPASMAFKFGRIFGVRAGPPLGASRFQIGGTAYDNGLSLHSPASIVYRVPEGARWLRAEAGVDDSVVAPGEFDLVIQGDGKELLRHSFGQSEDRKPLPINLDIAGIRRITISLDPADGQDIGDQLNLCKARMTK
ncbi:MAG TPA: NPCBM/NEW2 domain-containing protein, partial [Pirellulaceae bacterium]|nr:NPCBM/NEW2 domain-containing protein [Pirellulaceae bacterium]